MAGASVSEMLTTSMNSVYALINRGSSKTGGKRRSKKANKSTRKRKSGNRKTKRNSKK